MIKIKNNNYVKVIKEGRFSLLIVFDSQRSLCSRQFPLTEQQNWDKS